VMSRAFKESQHAKDNGGGLKGYLLHLANERPEIFARLLAKLLVLQEKERAQTAKALGKPVKYAAYRTAAEVRAAPIARGTPVRKVDKKGTPSSSQNLGRTRTRA
jgi:hypothetical protein